MVMMMMMKISMEERLPRELVANVLSRLPTKCLMKCKCVCKSWFDLITDPHFITNYYVFYNNLILHHHDDDDENENGNGNLFVIRRPSLYGLKTYISVLSWNLDPNKGLDVSNEIFNPPCEYNSDLKYWNEIMGPCNGIYFLEGNPYVLMNPSLRQFKALPQSNFTVPCGADCLSSYAGFGFDPKTNDYKVVAIKYLRLEKTDERRIEAELYSLNSNSWRKLGASLPTSIETWRPSRIYTYVNNCCHWLGSGVQGDDVVLAFDMVNELFRKIKVPKIRCSSSEEDDCTTLVPFTESGTIGAVFRGAEKCFDVWVMKDYWDEGSWTKKYTVGPIQVMIHKQLVGFYGSNKFLWRDSDERLVLYDPDSIVKTKDLQVFGRYDSIRAARYMESLVSLHRGKEISSDHQCFSCRLVPDPLLYKSG